jgi:hypothetical protein
LIILPQESSTTSTNEPHGQGPKESLTLLIQLDFVASFKPKDIGHKLALHEELDNFDRNEVGSSANLSGQNECGKIKREKMEKW